MQFNNLKTNKMTNEQRYKAYHKALQESIVAYFRFHNLEVYNLGVLRYESDDSPFHRPDPQKKPIPISKLKYKDTEYNGTQIKFQIFRDAYPGVDQAEQTVYSIAHDLLTRLVHHAFNLPQDMMETYSIDPTDYSKPLTYGTCWHHCSIQSIKDMTSVYFTIQTGNCTCS